MAESTAPADPVQRAHDQVRQTVIDIGGIISGVADRVKEIINDALKAIFDPLGAALQAQLQVFGDLVGGLLQNLATTPDIVEDFWTKWSELAAKDDGPGTALTRWILANFGGEWGKQITSTTESDKHWFWDYVKLDSPEAPHIGTVYDEFKSKPGWYQAIWGALFTVMLTGAYGQELANAELSALGQSVRMNAPVEPLSPAELANAVVQTQVGQEWATQQAARSGLTPELFGIMVNTFGLPPGLGEMLNLLNRGVVDEPTVRQSIAESHTKTKYTDALLQLRYAIPTIAEITHWLTRDAFIDEFVQRYGMDAEYSLSADKANPLFQANAVNADYIKYIWRSHWTLPSPGAGAEMYFRTAPDGAGEDVSLPGGGSTKRIISRDDLQRLYRAAGFEPWWREPLLKIAFQPLSRIDSRRLYLAGQIDDGEFFRSALNLGYDEDTAGKFLAWMQANKAAQQKAQVEKHVAPILTAMRQAYQRGQIGAAEFKARAVDLGEDADIVDVWLQQLDLERETDRANRVRDGLHRLFVDGFISEDEAGNRLQSDGFTSAEWLRLRDDWRVDAEFRAASDDAKAARALTKTNLLNAYRDRLIEESELRQRLTAMGYHQDEQDIWISLTNFEGAQRVANTAREGTHEDYVDQIIDAATARSQLAQLDTPSAAIEAYLRRWTSERRRKTPSISAGQIEAAYKNATLAEDKARSLLSQLRYTSDEVDVLIGAWRQDLSISEQRLQLEQQRFQVQQQQFAARQQATQARTEQAQQASQARLAQQEAFAQAQQARQQEASVTRAANAAANAVQRQATALQAASARQDKALVAAQAREQQQLAERDKALAQAQTLANQRQAATDARQQKTLDAAVARQQATFQQQDKLYQQRVADRITAEQRAQGYKIAAEQRAQAAEQAKEQRVTAARIQTELRSNRRELEKELRTQSFTIAREQRQQASRIAGEQRLSERKGALAQAQAQAESTIANLRLQQQQTAQQSAQDILSSVEQQVQSQISNLPSGQ